MPKKIITTFILVFFIILFCELSFSKTKSQNNRDNISFQYNTNNDTITFSNEKISPSKPNSEKKAPYQFYLQKASKYFSNGEPQKAEEQITKGLSLYNGNQELQMASKVIESIKTGEISEKLGVTLSTGIFYLSAKTYKKAIIEFKKAKRINPNYPSTFLCLGISRIFLKDFYFAKKDLLKAKSLYEKINDPLGIKITEKYISSIDHFKNLN